MGYRGFISPIAAVIFPYLLFEFLRREVSLDSQWVMPRGHFYIVSAVAIIAMMIAIAVGVAGSRLRNIKVIVLSLAFISLGEVFALHGLSTPNFLLHTTHLPPVAAQLSILLTTGWLWVSSLTSDHRFIRALTRWERLLLPLWITALSIFGMIMMIFPDLVSFIPLNVQPLNWTMAVIATILNLLTMYRYYQSYRYSRFPLQITIVYSAGWLITSQWIMVLGQTWHLSWWIYHFLLLASMIVMVIGLFKQYASSPSLTGILRALFTTDPVERITDCISPSVKALVIATETKDPYTAGHNFRVTMYAIKLGEELQLNPEQLRALAQGTIVHDVGKINIPDSILNKPGKLTPEERSIIEMHPVKGYEMCKNLGFMIEELSIIRSHHEKWDGTGYPDMLKEEKIPLLARVVAVADVYDALTSNRSYRKAWSHQEAIKFLTEQKGTHFDPSCVEAWIRVCKRDPSVYQYPLQVINGESTLSVLSSS